MEGKTVRGARTTGDLDGPVPHLLAVIDDDAHVVFGQVTVNGKASEIARF